MSVPAIGHGELLWTYKDGQLRVLYALPWDHPEQQPTLNGSSIFFSNGKTLPVNYFIQHIPAMTPTTQMIKSADGLLSVTVTANGMQPNDLYISVIQGYSYEVNNPQQLIGYEINALRIPRSEDMAKAVVEEFRYPSGKDGSGTATLPNDYTISVTIPAGHELCRWSPSKPMELVPAQDMKNLELLGVFMIEKE